MRRTPLIRGIGILVLLVLAASFLPAHHGHDHGPGEAGSCSACRFHQEHAVDAVTASAPAFAFLSNEHPLPCLLVVLAKDHPGHRTCPRAPPACS